jgi:hypothetical protein
VDDAPFDGHNGWSGWQWMFLVEGIPSILVGLWVLAYLDDRITHAKWLTDDEKALLQRNIANEDQHKEDPPVAQVLSSPRVWLMSAIYFSFVMGLYGVSFWLPTIIKQTGVKGALDVGLLTAIPYGCAVIGMILFAQRRPSRRAALAYRDSGAGRRGGSGAVGAMAQRYDHGDGGPDARHDRHPDHAATVLEPADVLPGRNRRRRRHRADQLAGKSGWLPQSLRGGLAQGHDADTTQACTCWRSAWW